MLALALLGPPLGVKSKAESFDARTRADEPNGLGHLIQITISAADLDRLRSDRRTDVPATVQADGWAYRNVAVHVKGSQGSLRSIDDKPSLTLDFENLRSSGPLASIGQLHLNNAVEDPSYLKEILAGELFGAVGIPCPRAGHVAVELNGRRLGLYVWKEGFTEEMMARTFRSTRGSFYEPEPGQDVSPSMKRKWGEEAEGQAALERLHRALLEPDLTRRWSLLEESLDVNRFLSLLALEVLICHWDGYALAGNNFRVYYQARANKLVLLPTGMDQVFSKPDMPCRPDMSGRVARGIMQTPEGQRRYDVRIKSLLGTVFQAQACAHRVQELLSTLRHYTTPREFSEIRPGADELCAAIRAREKWVYDCLTQPEPLAPDFASGPILLRHWRLDDGTGEHGSVSGRVDDILLLVAGGKTSASWRTTVRLNSGRYRLSGEVQVESVKALPFGRNQGAVLRVEGRSDRSRSLTGTSGWERLELDFTVTEAEELVVLICELRGVSGRALFRENTLKLGRLP